MVSSGHGDPLAISVVAGGVALRVGVVFGASDFYSCPDALGCQVANRQGDVPVLERFGAGAMLASVSFCPLLFRT